MTLERKQVPTGEFTCLACGYVADAINTPSDDGKALEEGETFSCGACGAGHRIVPDGLELIDGANSPEDRARRLRYWATQRG